MTERDSDVDPEDFLRTLLKISREDAEKVRTDAAKVMEREDRQRVKDADQNDHSA